MKLFKNLLLMAAFFCSFAACDDGNGNNNTNNVNNINNINNINNTNNATCGDATVGGEEVCDGTALGTATCASEGFVDGTLACRADCTGYDTAACNGTAGDYGFEYRRPQTRTLSCTQPPLNEPREVEFRDADQLCTFVYGGRSGFLYFQATPAVCEVLMSDIAVYNTVGWISFDGQVTPLVDPTYDWGSNHRNNWFTFVEQDVTYKYYHSSLGLGWRACFPMDCLQVLAADNQFIEDGCTTDRILPIVCNPILDDGTFAPLVDTFEKCEGDPNL